MMQPWWERFSRRLNDELEALKRVGFDFSVDDEELAAGRIVLHGAASAGRLGPIDVSIVYPDSYPHQRPAVFQRTGERLSRHQNPFSGNYCLLGRDSDQWQTTMTAADLVAGLDDLVALVDEGGEALASAEDPQGEPVSAYYPGGGNGCVLVPGWVDDIADDIPGGTLCVRFNTDPPFPSASTQGADPIPFGQGLLTELVDHNGNVLGTADDDLANQFNGPEWSGHWVRVDEGDAPDPERLLSYLAELEPKITRPGSARGEGRWRHAIHAALIREEVQRGTTGQSLLFVTRSTRRSQKRNGPEQVHAKLLGPGARYSPATLIERVRPLRTLANANVTVVGLGSLGAPLVKQLAQAQIGRLNLIDNDIVEAGTTVRWPAGIRAAGVSKPIFLAAEIAADYPFVTTHAVPFQLGGTPPPGNPPPAPDRQVLEPLLTNCDLLIDATAEHNVSRHLSDLSNQLSIPVLHVWSIDGYGGVVALLRPGQTGCLHCLDVALETGDIASPPSAADPTATRVQPTSCRDITFIASTPDLLPLVNQAARVAFSRLTAGDPDGWGPIDSDVFVLALRRSDGRPLPAPEWTTYSLKPYVDCWYCTP